MAGSTDLTAPFASATAIARAVRHGAASAEAIARAALSRIAAEDGAIRAFVHVDRSGALARARAIDDAVSAGHDPGPLAGVPIALKDNLSDEGQPLTAASRMLAGYVAPYTATAVKRLRAAGAVVLGRTNLDEFAMGSSGEHSVYGPTANPWDHSRVPGGSSSGSAAAVAAGFVPLALGSDTGGSIRLPAALCGVLGLKPTYGRVSRYGLVAFGSSLDAIGPLARNVSDAALAYGVMAGHDPRDATSLDAPVELPDLASPASLAGVRLGVLEEAFAACTPDVARAGRAVLATLAERGATGTATVLSHARYWIAAYYLIATSEASANLARYDGVRFGRRAEGVATLEALYAKTRGECFGPEVRCRIMLGTFALSAGYADAYYRQALRARTLIARDYAQAFATCDLLVSPTAPMTAFARGAKLDNPLAMYATDVNTVGANLAGIPALSVPIGLDAQGLPIGLQVQAPAGAEARLLEFGHAVAAVAGDLGHPPASTR